MKLLNLFLSSGHFMRLNQFSLWVFYGILAFQTAAPKGHLLPSNTNAVMSMKLCLSKNLYLVLEQCLSCPTAFSFFYCAMCFVEKLHSLSA